jgi:predicted RNA-binding Zn ribbon-like protein
MNAVNYKYQFVGGNLALDFVNTVAYRADPERLEDRLQTADQARQWAIQAGLPGRNAIHSRSAMAKADLRRVRDVREDLFAIFQAMAAAKPISTPALNRLARSLQSCRSKQTLVMQGREVGWVWDRSAGTVDFLLYPVLMAAVDLLISGAHGLVRQCAGEGCGWLFLDRSNAGKRRWCSMADCGNRNKARRHYQRTVAMR